MVADSCSCRLGIWQRNAAPRGVGCAARPARTTSPPIVGPGIRRRRRRAATDPKEGGDRDRGWDAEEPEHHEQIDRRARHAPNCKGIPPAGPPVWSLFTTLDSRTRSAGVVPEARAQQGRRSDSKFDWPSKRLGPPCGLSWAATTASTRRLVSTGCDRAAPAVGTIAFSRAPASAGATQWRRSARDDSAGRRLGDLGRGGWR